MSPDCRDQGEQSWLNHLFGVMPFKSGTMELHGKAIAVKSPAKAIKNKMGFVTEDRKSEGIAPRQPIRDNMLLTVRAVQSLFGLIFKDGIRDSRKLVPMLGEQVDIRTDSFDREDAISKWWKPTESGACQVAGFRCRCVHFR